MDHHIPDSGIGVGTVGSSCVDLDNHGSMSDWQSNGKASNTKQEVGKDSATVEKDQLYNTHIVNYDSTHEYMFLHGIPG